MAQLNPQRFPTSVTIGDESGFTVADVLHLTNKDALAIAIVDGSGNQITSFGGASGSNPAAGNTGSLVPLEADYVGVNIGGSLVGVTGLSLTNAKAMTVAIVDASGNQITSFGGAGGGGVQFADNTASGLTPTGTLAMGWDSANSKVRALKVDLSQNLAVVVENFPATQVVSGTVSVSNFPATQAVSGTVTANQGTATAAAKWSTQIDTWAAGTLNVNVQNATIAVTQSTSPWVTQDNANAATAAALPSVVGVIGGSDYGGIPHVQVAKVDASGFIYIGNFPATQTVSGTVSVSNFPATQAVSGTVTANQGTAAALSSKWPVQITDGTNTMPTGDSAARTIHTTVDNASIAVTGTFWQATQPVSFTNQQVAQGTAAALAGYWPVRITDGTNTMPTGDASARSIHTTIDNASIAVTGTFWQATQPVSGTVQIQDSTGNALSSTSGALNVVASNAALETGGNLATVATYSRNNAQFIDVLNSILAQLKYLNLLTCSNMSAPYTDLDGMVLDVFQGIN